jgi:hypothetical protein
MCLRADWAMYHVARNWDSLKTHQPWHWYLERAAVREQRLALN